MNVILCTTTALENWQHSGKFGRNWNSACDIRNIVGRRGGG